jgi:hypothetical protein
MKKWAWVDKVGEPREYTLLDFNGNHIDESYINYMHDGIVIKAQVSFFVVDDNDPEKSYPRFIKLVDENQGSWILTRIKVLGISCQC